MTISKRAAWLLAILLSFALVASACGDDDDDDTTTGDDSADSADDGTGDDSTGDDSTGDDGGDDMAEDDGGDDMASDGGQDFGDITGTVSVSGSSTVEPISVAAAELFNDEFGDGVEITVNGPGTSAGFSEFCAGDTDINDASRAVKDTEEADCVPFVELRVAFDGIAAMVHPSNPLECVNLTDLYAISGPESEGNTWEDAAAFAAELGSSTEGWPTGTVDVIAPGTESGTYGSYIEIVLEGLAEERAEAGEYTPQTDENGDDILIRTDYAGQPNDDVIIEGISGTESAYGWVGFAFAAQAGDSVKVLDVFNEETGECVTPTIETIADGTYPISRSLYIYVNTDKIADNPALVAYVDYYLGDAYVEAVESAFGPGIGYVALPDDLKAETDAAWAAAKG